MISVIDLQSRVAAAYDPLALPSWSDPHAGMASPRDEEYSRVTDAERYRIVHARARAWAAVLGKALGARVEHLAPARAVDDGRPPAFDRGVRLVPDRPDALPVVLLERDVATQAHGAPLAVLEIGVVRPDVVVEVLPNCGCDACDSGSRGLLDAIDTTISAMVGGPHVVLRARTWRAQWHPGGGQASSQGDGPDFRDLMDLCQRLVEDRSVPLPDGCDAFVGRSWLT